MDLGRPARRNSDQVTDRSWHPALWWLLGATVCNVAAVSIGWATDDSAGTWPIVLRFTLLVLDVAFLVVFVVLWRRSRRPG